MAEKGMKYQEKLTWILKWKMRVDIDQRRRNNVAFVRSLNQKCDDSGKSTLDLHSPEANEILEAIMDYCQENKCWAEGTYQRIYDLPQSDWYVLQTRGFSGRQTEYQEEDVLHLKGGRFVLPAIRACNIADGKPRCDSRRRAVFVSDEMRRFLEVNETADVRFCWLRDIGHYRGEQYFAMIPRQRISSYWRASYSYWRSFGQRQQIRQFGAPFDLLMEVFPRRLKVRCQDVVLRDELPSGGIVFKNRAGLTGYTDFEILIHRDIAAQLHSQGLLTKKDLQPLAIMDEPPEGYELVNTVAIPQVTEEICAIRLEECYRHLAKKKPERRPSITRVRELFKARKEMTPEDFPKRLAPKQQAALKEGPYATLVPYYALANGFDIDENSECHFLSYQQSLKETERFQKQHPDGQFENAIVFALYDCGDAMLLLPDGKVQRWDQETADVSEQWDSLAAFYCEVAES